ILGDRKNSAGFLWSDPKVADPLMLEIDGVVSRAHTAAPLIDGKSRTGASAPVLDPADRRRAVGSVTEATPSQAIEALASAHAAQIDWDKLGGKARAGILYRAADLFEKNQALLMALAVREAGKTLPNALG